MHTYQLYLKPPILILPPNVLPNEMKQIVDGPTTRFSFIVLLLIQK